MSKPLNRWALFSGLTNNKMKMKIKKLLMALAFSMLSAIASAQEARVGINTTTPKTTLDVSGKLNTAGTAIDHTDMTGLQAPRLTRAELTAKGNTLYGTDQKGALVYITDISAGDVASQRVNINAVGYYYFDGSVWQKVSAAANEPWYNVATNTGATANTQDIYQTGKVGIGTSAPTAPLHVSSATAGAIRIQDGTQGAGKVLTSDNNGIGTWQAAGSFSWSYRDNPLITISAKRTPATAMKYSTIISESVPAYNSSTGAFTAPFDGSYTFSGVVYWPADDWSVIEIYIATATKYVRAFEYAGATSYYYGSTKYGPVTISLSAGEQAYIALAGRNTTDTAVFMQDQSATNFPAGTSLDKLTIHTGSPLMYLSYLTITYNK